MTDLAGQSLDALDTPRLLVDLDVLDRNLAFLQDACRRHGKDLRIHFRVVNARVKRLVAEEMGERSAEVGMGRHNRQSVLHSGAPRAQLCTQDHLNIKSVTSSQLARLRSLRGVSVDALRKALPAGAILVELVRRAVTLLLPFPNAPPRPA
jgi:hypothetical protein